MAERENAPPGAPAGRGRWVAWLRGSMMPVFIGLTTALLALALVIAQTILAQRDARIRAGNSGEMLTAFQQVMQTMLEAESSQRGYVLTADSDYLRSYLEAKQRLASPMVRLRMLARHDGADPEAIGRVNWIAGLTDAKFSEMDRTVVLTRTGMQGQAMMIIDSDIGRQQMEAVRAAAASEGTRRARQRRDAFARAATLERRLIPLIAVLGIAIVALVAAGFRAERSRATAAAEAEQAAALREANERAQLLARELNHRVKNLFSVILSIVSLSGRKQAASGEVVESIRARIHALSLAHAASQGEAAGTSVRLGPVVEKTMEPYADPDRSRVRIAGPDLELPARMITPLGLIIHELATNAVKYGALSVDGGTVDIYWEVKRGGDAVAGDVILNWIEAGGPPLAAPGTPKVSGFGSQMITLAAHQLGGGITRQWPENGALARLVFPLPV